ncbi:hypothetical protein J2Z60_001820 [Lactobacillus colini]|uniref:HTH cro/C1-type domain-containing protein n=1 Tax=Lactobacillus colini TaxID=1819254 RepID=A0ABS4MG11_9LACO|nr:helix-turn-helix transcriptional regulator [Lactobacillus colini]MBP2058632.1 hypothetical protein [Lactobacillus colini]
MGSLTYPEKVKIQLMRNKSVGLKPTTQKDIAKKFQLSEPYVSDIIKGAKTGPNAKKWIKKFNSYLGMED